LVAAGVTMVRSLMKTVVFARHVGLAKLEYVERVCNVKQANLPMMI
jgi:hypothetical protein